MTLPLEIIDIIIEYAPKYRFLKWIDETKIDLKYLSLNTNSGAIELLKQHPEKINWIWLSQNPIIFELDENYKQLLYHLLYFF